MTQAHPLTITQVLAQPTRCRSLQALAAVESFHPPPSRKEHKVRKQTRYWGASGSEATRDGHGAVVAEHSTEERGEVRPKRPTGGKATPGRAWSRRKDGKDFEPTNRPNGILVTGEG